MNPMESDLNKFNPELSRETLNSDKSWKITKVCGVNERFCGKSAPKSSRTADGPKLEDKSGDLTSRDLTVMELILDQANLCTFIGTVLTTFAIANIWKRRYFLGLTMSTLATLADILDGPIARSSHERRQPIRTVGKYLDNYSDVISHFVVPASLLMEVSDLNPACVLLAALFVCTGVLRHARGEIVERLDGDSCVYGVSSDYLVSTFTITMHLALVVEAQTLVIVLSMVMAISIFVSLSKVFRSRRYSGLDLFIVGIFYVWLALSCIVLRYFLLSKKGGSFWVLEEEYNNKNQEIGFYSFTIGQLATGLLAITLALAYPCYYRFIERNP